MVESIHRKETNNAVRDPSLFILISTFGLHRFGVPIFSNFDKKYSSLMPYVLTVFMSCSSDVRLSVNLSLTDLFLRYSALL